MSDHFKSLSQAMPFLLETEDSRSLHFNYLKTQSQMYINMPDMLSLEYTRLMMGFMLFQRHPQRMLMIGLGGGSLAKFCYRNLINSAITVVEINPAVIELRDIFNIPPNDERLSVVLGDGAEFMQTIDGSFNTLLVDGYTADGIPPELSTQSFFDDCARALSPNGIAVFNFDNYDPNYNANVEKIGESFGNFPLQVSASKCANVAIFACKGDLKLDHATCITALSLDLKPNVLAPMLPAFNRIRLSYKMQHGYGIYQWPSDTKKPACGY